MLRISIVTPSLNPGAYLEQALVSVLEQGHPDLELIVADGGSNDGSVSVLERYSTRLSAWWSAPDGGPAAAVNAAFERTTGDVMGWLNADDRLLPGSLEIVAEIFEHRPEVEWLTAACLGLMDEEGRLVLVGNVPGYHRDAYRLGLNGDLFPWSRFPYVQQESTFWRRSLWERAGPLDSEFEPAADFELWLRFFKHAELHAVDTVLGAFRSHSGQRTAKEMDRYRKQARRALGSNSRLLPHAAGRLMPRIWKAPYVRWDRRARTWAVGRRRLA